MKVNELKAAIDTGFTEVRADIVEVKADIVEMKADIVTLDERIRSEGITTRRHFDVVAEGLRSEIRLLATAVATTSSTLERSIAENRSEHATFISVLENHEVRLTALERLQ